MQYFLQTDVNDLLWRVVRKRKLKKETQELIYEPNIHLGFIGLINTHWKFTLSFISQMFQSLFILTSVGSCIISYYGLHFMAAILLYNLVTSGYLLLFN